MSLTITDVTGRRKPGSLQSLRGSLLVMDSDGVTEAEMATRRLTPADAKLKQTIEERVTDQ